MPESEKEGWYYLDGFIAAHGSSRFSRGSKTWPEADAKALAFVKARAAEGSKPHQDALAKVIKYKLLRPIHRQAPTLKFFNDE